MANIPVLPQKDPMNLFYQTNLNQALQGALSDNGWTLPQQTTDNINEVAPSMADGTIWYDSDTNSVKVKIDGTVKTVTVS